MRLRLRCLGSLKKTLQVLKRGGLGNPLPWHQIACEEGSAPPLVDKMTRRPV